MDWSAADVFTDPEGDFWQGSGSPSPIIQFSPVDLIKVYTTNDNQYLYVKFEAAGALPTLPLTYSGNEVHKIGWCVLIDNDRSTATGNIVGESGADIILSLRYQLNGEAGWYGNYYFYDPNGYPGWWYDSHDPQTGEPLIDLATERLVNKVGGGTNENYVIWRVPLSGLGISKGAMINVSTWAESESDLYHHFARDPAPGEDQWFTNIEIK